MMSIETIFLRKNAIFPMKRNIMAFSFLLSKMIILKEQFIGVNNVFWQLLRKL